MSRLQSIATYLPIWGDDKARVLGLDEDALTLAVAAGRAALAAASAVAVDQVVFVTRDLPLLEGGSEGVLLAGLDLDAGVRATTVLGGAPATLDAITAAADGTLVIAVDTSPAAAGAVVIAGSSGAPIEASGRSSRSLPIKIRDTEGNSSDYEDPRLLRVRGIGTAFEALGLQDKPLAVAGLGAKDAAAFTQGSPIALQTLGASSSVFALAALVEQRAEGAVVAVEQATATAAKMGSGDTAVVRFAPTPRPLPKRKLASGGDIKISLAAYERAFDGKLRLAAGKCTACGALHLPQRYRCTECGDESARCCSRFHVKARSTQWSPSACPSPGSPRPTTW